MDFTVSTHITILQTIYNIVGMKIGQIVETNCRTIGIIVEILFSFNRACYLLFIEMTGIDIQLFLRIQSVLSINKNLSIRKLLVSIN